MSSKAFALALAASIALGTVVYTPAEAKMKWNPMDWFSGEENTAQQNAAQDTAIEEARRKAELAEQQAKQAMDEAQAALTRATQARKEAEALQVTPVRKSGKPMVSTPAAAAEEESPAVGATRTEESEVAPPVEVEHNTAIENQSADGQATHNEPWNPLNWFKKSETKAEAEAPAEATRQAPVESLETKVETEKKSGGWKRFALFGIPEDAEANAEGQAQPETTSAPGVEQVDPVVKTQVALLETEKGNIAFELYPDEAPETVANFVKLVGDGFYNRFNMKFHRVVPGFVIQTGDPTGTGAGGSKKRIPLEAKNKLSHNAKGVVAMARGGDPNSASSQFYITLAPQTTLDGKYAIFGKVISGIDVLDKIEKDDMLYGIKLVDANSVVRDAQPEKKKFFSSLF